MIHTIDLHFLDNPQTIAAFLIENGTEPILVETGAYSTFETLKKGIENLGFAIEDVRHVLLSHIHLDHAGAAWAFAKHGAKIYVHPFGAKHLENPTKLMDSAKRIYQDQMDRLWGDMQAIPFDQLVQVEHGKIYSFGNQELTAWHTPGHASHHVAWQLGNLLFTGDVAGVQIGTAPVVAPCPPPDIDFELWFESIKLIRRLKPEKMYLTHFGEKTNIEAHLADLEQNMKDNLAWISEHSKKGESLEQMSPKFDAWVRNSLISKGFNDFVLAQYQAANPASMSVAGLLRYLQKKS